MKIPRLLLLAALPLAAHVGSPDVFYEGAAGPYRLLVTIRPPQVVPGVAEVEIRSAAPDVRQVHIVPLRLGDQYQNYAPVPDLAKPSPDDPHFYSGGLWLMATGSWQVRIDVDGARGPGRLAVPVPALATRISGMTKAVAAALIPLGLLLCVGLVSIAGAAVRYGNLETGRQPDVARVRRSRAVMAATTAVVLALLWFGNSWWGSEAGFYGRIVYKPLKLAASLQPDGRMTLRLENPAWLDRPTDDLLPDHGHLMHLYVIRIPEMSAVWHLHPQRGDDGEFTQQLPAMPAGRYALYGDVVHANGLPETATAEVEIPQTAGHALEGDDSGGDAAPLSQADYSRASSPLPGGWRMIFDRPAGTLHAKRPYELKFHVEDAGGVLAEAGLYMGMLGHAAFVSADRTVFAHVHPSGSVPMPALQLAQPDNPHAGHMMMAGAIPAAVSFPYGFPKAGPYRVFVQMKKQAGEVVTGAFDVQVAP